MMAEYSNSIARQMRKLQRVSKIICFSTRHSQGKNIEIIDIETIILLDVEDLGLQN
jgi:hypothetical protein